MAHSPDWEKLAMAGGSPSPVWPLPTVTPKFATWSLGGGRPFGCAADKCERWHAGIDLTGAPDGAPILAPEDALVVGIDRGWSSGSKAAFLRTDSGLFLVLGGFGPGSHKEFDVSTGQRVRRGDKLLAEGTLAELRSRAGGDNATLEDVYLQLVGAGAA